MQSYIRKILQPENLPNWVSLIAIVAVLWTLNSELSRQSLEETKLAILKQLNNTATPMQVDQVLNSGYLAAISELVSDGLVLQTSQGYEIRRYDPRIKDDVAVAVSLVFGTKEDGNDTHGVIPENCKEFNNKYNQVFDLVMKMETLRESRLDNHFKDYLLNHKDLFFKQIFLMTYHRKSDLSAMLNCFDFSITGNTNE